MNLNCKACIDTAKRAFDDRFKYYGDLWLVQRDIFDNMTLNEVFELGLSGNVFLLPRNEMPYIDGSKIGMTNHVALISAINRLLKTKDAEKYRQILEKRSTVKIVDYSKIAKQQEQRDPMYG